MMEIAGGQPVAPREADGVSFVPLLRGAKQLDRDALYWHYPHYSNQGGTPSSAVRQGDWKLIEFLEDGRLGLFNLKDDPGERRNLVLRAPERAAELNAMLKQWRRSVGAEMPRVNPAFDPAAARQERPGAEPPTPPVR
jgi:arylsulfatase A-like enzyme